MVDTITVRAVGELGTAATLTDIQRVEPGGTTIADAMVIRL